MRKPLTLREIAAAGLAIVMAAATVPAQASQIYESPASWRLENYITSGVTIYFTSAPECTNGQLIFGSTVTDVMQDRLWSLVLTAKSTGKKVGIFYSVANNICYIASFYIQE